MYSFQPDPDQEKLIEVTRRLAREVLRPAAHEAEEGGQMPKGVIEKGWELGLLQTAIPEAQGGLGEHSRLTSALAAEELACGDLAAALALLTPNLFALPLALMGTETQKLQYLPALANGGWQSYSAAFIEPHFDFDPLAMRCRAKQVSGGYEISGQKNYVPFAPEAPALLLYADLDGQTQVFIVEKEAAGLEIGERQKLLGINGLPVYELSMEGLHLPAEARLGGPEGHPFAPLLASMRVALAALGVGLARASFEYARDYAKEREVFGSKVAQKQSIAFMLAEMATEIEATRLLTWEAAWQLDQDEEEAGHSAYLAHSGAADMAMMVTDRGVQILGGHGYIREHPVELWMRNGRGIASLVGLAML